MIYTMKLADLKNGQKGTITGVRGRGQFRKRITEMGFVRGKTVTVIKNAPMRDPIEYKLMDYNISLRRKEAALIDVEVPVRDEVRACPDHSDPYRHGERRRMKWHRHRHSDNSLTACGDDTATTRPARGHDASTIRVALVGNPNSGKTTLFNYATGARERVGNYGGVTIDAKEARISRNGRTFIITDLPGTYSLTAYSPEELYVRQHIIEDRPDVIVNIIDASNLERNLYLTTQLIELGQKVVVALNMYDELQTKGDSFDYETLGNLLGIPFVPTIGTKGIGIDNLLDTVTEVHENRNRTVRSINIYYGADIEKAMAFLGKIIQEKGSSAVTITPRYAAVKLLEKDSAMQRRIDESSATGCEVTGAAKKLILALESELKQDSETIITDARYGFIAGALRETYRPGTRPAVTVSERIDGILTHQVLGFPIFLLFMWLTFQLTFTLGRYPMNWIESGIAHLSRFIVTAMPAGLLRELMTDGVIAGAGGVIMFIPNILILFFMISLMEDTGYMARAAFIMDRLMHAIGLHGKSFIPLIMGFGCNVPAIMATRTLESRKDRILTMLIIPFMSCSARLPVYVLFISAFFPSHAGSVLFALYLAGIAVAVSTAMVIKKTVFRKAEVPFVMELPPYRAPRMKNTLRHMWERGKEYLKKIGGIVLIAAVLIWALGRFPSETRYSKNYDSIVADIRAEYDSKINSARVGDPAALKSITDKADAAIKSIEQEKDLEHLENSYIGRIGRVIEPVMEPLGFDWKMSVSIITGLAAKEIAVSTMGILYHADKDAPEGSGALIKKIKEQRYGSGPRAGQPIFDPATALAYMAFMLLYIPCVATLVTMRRESGTWKWPVFSALFSITLAWLAAFLIQQAGSLIR
jgi:ferrous iron transport protein B